MLYAAVSLALAFVLLSAAIVVWVQVKNPRDESEYLSRMAYARDAKQLKHPPTNDVLVNEGNYACDWLSDQPPPLWRTSPRFRFYVLADRFAQDRGLRPLGWSGEPDRSSVASEAWLHLCPALWQFHKPHYVFGGTSD